MRLLIDFELLQEDKSARKNIIFAHMLPKIIMDSVADALRNINIKIITYALKPIHQVN